MSPGRRASDHVEEVPPPTLGILTPEERTSLVDALHVALKGPHRRAGDADRWRGLLARIGAPIPPGT